ncbi:hypothetical protein HOLleu_09452 [Holothuria leucospilota]|uniref:Uncharacterized protein n=1 Tax=Holothuria leucospilota TaxID=206669 RepID=A0A9Q1HEY9_HOLLE|nr:hypothetical protein HOLleu_09452 [Holothuria leucospilota]
MTRVLFSREQTRLPTELRRPPYHAVGLCERQLSEFNYRVSEKNKDWLRRLASLLLVHIHRRELFTRLVYVVWDLEGSRVDRRLRRISDSAIGSDKLADGSSRVYIFLISLIVNNHHDGLNTR